MNIVVTITKEDVVIGSAVTVDPEDGDVTVAIHRAMDRARKDVGDQPVWPCQIDVREEPDA